MNDYLSESVLQESRIVPLQQPMIFVCGPSRSGTALLRASLNRHPKVHLAGETHYFDDLRIRLGNSGDRQLDAAETSQALEYFGAIGHRPYGHGGDPDSSRIDAGELADLAVRLGGTGDAYFTAFCSLEAERVGKEIAGEKTPRHVFRIDEIMSAFPNGRLICMTRDPRAIVASYRDWRNRGGFDLEADPGHRVGLQCEERRAKSSYHPATIALLWRAQVNSALAARSRYGTTRIWIQRYEDLVADPELELERISAWLGLEFDRSMLCVPMHNSSYSTYRTQQGVSREAVARWKQQLDAGEVRLVERICARLMRQTGYSPGLTRGGRWLEATLWLAWPLSVIKAVLANRQRSGNLPQYVFRRMRLALRG